MLDTRSRWRSAAACQSCDPDLFFPLSSSGPAVEQIARAKEICARCPVRRECLAFALRTRQAHGVWGGLTEQERYPAGRHGNGQAPDLKSIRSADSPRPTRTVATISGGNRPCWTTPGVPDNRTASAAGSSTGPL
jgi:WhiB family transcriptional regulator, redox-sensing transcriptional regulator